MGEEVKKLMTSYLKQPPRKVQSAVYTGPITITDCQKFQWLREQLQKDRAGINPAPTMWVKGHFRRGGLYALPQ